MKQISDTYVNHVNDSYTVSDLNIFVKRVVTQNVNNTLYVLHYSLSNYETEKDTFCNRKTIKVNDTKIEQNICIDKVVDDLQADDNLAVTMVKITEVHNPVATDLVDKNDLENLHKIRVQVGCYINIVYTIFDVQVKYVKFYNISMSKFHDNKEINIKINTKDNTAIRIS